MGAGPAWKNARFLRADGDRSSEQGVARSRSGTWDVVQRAWAAPSAGWPRRRPRGSRPGRPCGRGTPSCGGGRSPRLGRRRCRADWSCRTLCFRWRPLVEALEVLSSDAAFAGAVLAGAHGVDGRRRGVDFVVVTPPGVGPISSCGFLGRPHGARHDRSPGSEQHELDGRHHPAHRSPPGRPLRHLGLVDTHPHELAEGIAQEQDREPAGEVAGHGGLLVGMRWGRLFCPRRRHEVPGSERLAVKFSDLNQPATHLCGAQTPAPQFSWNLTVRPGLVPEGDFRHSGDRPRASH